jgi:predicted amidophosphoribosyltransferase
MAYRQFIEPVLTDNTTSAWREWMKNQSVLHDYRPTPKGACPKCGQPGSGDYPSCWDCRQMRGYLDGFIPGSYSLESGLESLVATFKDGGPGAQWQSMPLGTILSSIFRKHGSCIARALGPDPIYTWVPSDDRARGFDHLEAIIRGVQGGYENRPWDKDVIARDFDHVRPARKSVQSEAYIVKKDVSGRSVLLFDDLWTTGASMISAAKALKQNGAATVVGVTLGRQFNHKNTFGNAQEILVEIQSRGWMLDDCNLES